MNNRRQLAKWQLTDAATAEDRTEWNRAHKLQDSRRDNMTRTRIVQALWKSGAIRTVPAFAT
jgi:hypothetical protein